MRQWASLATHILLTLLGGTAVTNAASIVGVITDATGGRVADATVIVMPIPRVPVTSAADGTFAVDGLLPGVYTVAVISWEFEPWARHGVRLKEGEKARLDVKLQPATRSHDVLYDAPTQADLARDSDLLRVMGEPALCEPRPTGAAESYRFIWCRTFHRPVVVRLTLEDDGDVRAAYKETDGECGYEIGKLVTSETIDVKRHVLESIEDPELAHELFQMLRERADERFWSLPYRVDDGTIGVDGATWTIEGWRNGRCHVVERWRPDPESGFRKFAEEILHFTGKRFYHDEYY